MTGVFRAVDLYIDRTGCGGVLYWCGAVSNSNIFTNVECRMHILIRYNQVSKLPQCQHVITTRHDARQPTDQRIYDRGSVFFTNDHGSITPRNSSDNQHCRNSSTPTNIDRAYYLKKKRDKRRGDSKGRGWSSPTRSNPNSHCLLYIYI